MDDRVVCCVKDGCSSGTVCDVVLERDKRVSPELPCKERTRRAGQREHEHCAVTHSSGSSVPWPSFGFMVESSAISGLDLRFQGHRFRS